MRYDPFETPLQQGILIRRYKRFLADVELDGRTITAHCPNSGSMLGMDQPGLPAMVRHVDDPKRKLAWTLEMVKPGPSWVGCNTMRPNHIVEWAIRTGQVPGIGTPASLRREVKYGTNSRIDLLLDEDHYVEVKNTTLARPGPGHDVPGPLAQVESGVALFPDAVTARGAKHMQELADMVAQGHQATVVFLVNRADCDRFEVAHHLDPAYADAFASAVDMGVKAVALGTEPGPEGWRIRGALPMA